MPERRPVAARLRNFCFKRFGLASNVIYVNLMDSQASTLPTGSIYNDHSAMFAVNLAEELVKAGLCGVVDGVDCDIGILTPYQAQHRVYGSALHSLAKDHPQVKTFMVADKVDRRQGRRVPCGDCRPHSYGRVRVPTIEEPSKRDVLQSQRPSDRHRQQEGY